MPKKSTKKVKGGNIGNIENPGDNCSVLIFTIIVSMVILFIIIPNMSKDKNIITISELDTTYMIIVPSYIVKSGVFISNKDTAKIAIEDLNDQHIVVVKVKDIQDQFLDHKLKIPDDFVDSQIVPISVEVFEQIGFMSQNECKEYTIMA